MVFNPELAEYEKDMKGKGDNEPDGGWYTKSPEQEEPVRDFCM